MVIGTSKPDRPICRHWYVVFYFEENAIILVIQLSAL